MNVDGARLYHHGIKGQKWGVRRYQNYDGSLTEEGIRRHKSGRVVKAENHIYDSMSDKEKYYLTAQHNTKEYTNINEHATYVIKNFMEKYGDTSIGFLDVWNTGKQQGSIAIAVDKNHRGEGISSKLVERGLDWFENNPNMSELVWSANKDNAVSNNLAKKYGFEQIDSDDKDWNKYVKTKSNKGAK